MSVKTAAPMPTINAERPTLSKSKSMIVSLRVDGEDKMVRWFIAVWAESSAVGSGVDSCRGSACKGALPALPGARFWYSIGVCTWSVRDLCLVRGAGERRMSRGRIATRQRVQERCPRRPRCGVLRYPSRCGKQQHVAIAGRLHALWDMPRGAAMLDRAREGGSPPWRAAGFGGYR